MPRFSDSNIESDAIIGKGIDLEELFDRRIVIEKIKIEPTKFPGKNASGMRMQMQVVINAEFMDTPDSDGDFFQKGCQRKGNWNAAFRVHRERQFDVGNEASAIAMENRTCFPRIARR